MNIEITHQDGQIGWIVRLDSHVVRFRSQAEAQAYVDCLHARLNAPHVPPAGCRALLDEPAEPEPERRA